MKSDPTSVYRYLDYRDFIIAWVEARKDHEQGLGAKLAQAAGCQAPLISLTLKKKAHLTAEQSNKLCKLFALNDDEADYFMHLLYFTKAGTPSLRKFHKKKIDGLRDVSLVLKNRLNLKTDQSFRFETRHETVYYTHWVHLALHMTLGVPDLQRPEALARLLGVDLATIHQSIDFLVEARLVEVAPTGYRVLRSVFHLPADSYLSGAFKRTMAQFALRLTEVVPKPDSLQYAAFARLGRDDFFLIRDLLAKALDKSLLVAQDSPDEEVVYLQVSAVPLTDLAR